MKNTVFALVLLVAGFTASCDSPDKELVVYSSGPELAGSSVDGLTLAKCLTDKGYRLYGTKYCSACNRQKALFGESGAKALKTIECRSSDDPEGRAECKRMGIRYYPTWVTPENDRLEGLQSLESLAERSGCPL